VDEIGGSSLVEKEHVLELEKWNKTLWRFAVTVHIKCKSRGSDIASISLLELEVLDNLISPIPPRVARLRSLGSSTYAFLLHISNMGET
ncbi:hypothetical protein KI387_008114, partial [Taxus chinensis]